MATAKKKAAKPKMQGNDITLDAVFTLPDGSVHEHEFTIVNARGCIPASELNSIHNICDTLKSSLIGKFGAGHVR